MIDKMNAPKFTPGPWEAGRNPAMATVLDGHEGKAIYPSGGDHHIGWANIYDDEGKLDMETALANAALIAQCPSLYENEERNLESLRTLLHFVEMITKSCDMNPVMRITALSGIVDTKERIAETEQLLAKCRGEVKEYE